jgi:feruloyl-CoA synthase
VITGHDREALGALLFPNLDACRGLCAGLAKDAPASDVLAHAAVRSRFQQLLDALDREATGSSTRITRIMLLDTPPSLDAAAVTDKGSINQRAVLKARAALVEELYAEPSGRRVIALYTEDASCSRRTPGM